jgi:4,5-dihydroxyphthalate decarboxylase
MPALPLTLAISEYDHVRDLVSGRVKPEGIELRALVLSIEEIFYRFTLHREWDVSEMAMGKYVSLRSQGDTSLTAIPVFPSRMFRHSSIYVRSDGPVRTPADLKGRRVGIPEWAQTAAIYSRGLLTHQYGIGLSDIAWVQAGVNEPGRTEKVVLKLPAGVAVERPAAKSLNGMLLAGEVDAVMTAHAPAAFEAGDPRVRRLFEDFMPVELAYWRETGIFPIMHCVAIQTRVLEAHPWIAMNLLTAFEAAKRRSVARAFEATASRFPIPWAHERASAVAPLFGPDYWPYGLEANRVTLEAFLQYAHEQGVTHRRLASEELFPPEVASAYKV